MPRKAFKYTYDDQTRRGCLQMGEYRADGTLAMTLLAWYPDLGAWMTFLVLSINTDWDLEPDEFLAHHDYTDLVADLAALGLFEETGLRLNYRYGHGYVEGQSVYRITDKGREYIQAD
jgi:hypothetical protein